MTVDGPQVDQPPARPSTESAPTSRTRSQAAIETYQARLRPWRIAYAGAIAVVVLVALVVVKVAYSHGEISHAKLSTAAKPAPSVALVGPGTTLTQAWTSADHTAIGTPYWGGTLITYSKHAVDGRDARTGAIRWSYTRSDRTVCTAAQMSGLTVAIFELNGNCDEVTTLDSGTGARKWTRTLDKDGQPINGHPTFLVTQYTLMLTTPDVIYAIDPVSSYDRWVFGQTGCKINSAVLGSAGALISQTCAKPDCSGKTFCGPGRQLLLRDGTAGETDDSKNPDQIKWDLMGNTSIPVSADALVSAAPLGSTRLTVLDVAKGKTLSTLALKAPVDADPTATQTARSELIRTGGLTYSIDASTPAIEWSAATTAPPTVTATDNAPLPDLTAAYLAVAGSGGIDLLDGSTGAVSRALAVSAPAAGSLIYPFGSGFVVAGPSTVVYK